jgi:hypothetical protein
MFASILVASAYALPAEPVLPHGRMNDVLFECYPSAKTFDDLKSCVQPKLTKANGFPADVDLENGHPALGPVLANQMQRCYDQAKGSLDALKSCAKSELSFVNFYEFYFQEAYSYKQTVPIEYLPKELVRLPKLVKSDITDGMALILSDRQTEHVNFCFLSSIVIPFKGVAIR